MPTRRWRGGGGPVPLSPRAQGRPAPRRESLGRAGRVAGLVDGPRAPLLVPAGTTRSPSPAAKPDSGNPAPQCAPGAIAAPALTVQTWAPVVASNAYTFPDDDPTITF